MNELGEFVARAYESLFECDPPKETEVRLGHHRDDDSVSVQLATRTYNRHMSGGFFIAIEQHQGSVMAYFCNVVNGEVDYVFAGGLLPVVAMDSIDFVQLCGEDAHEA